MKLVQFTLPLFEADLEDEESERLRNLALRSRSASDFADRLVPRVREPRVHYSIYKIGEELPFAAIDPSGIHRYEGRSDVRIERIDPSRYARTKYRSYLKRRQHYIDYYNSMDWKDRTFPRISNIGNYSNLLQYIGDRIGATHWKRLRGEETFEKGFGGRGYELFLPNNTVFLDIGIDHKAGCILLPQIAIANKRTGLGATIMDAIHDYAKEHRLRIVIYKITNPAYFRKFDWLKPKGHDFVYDPF